ncbi:hypothetical protein G4V62_10515 [Bacillaceae bacterium SIJ1]|uniref:VanZ family protein n=1 Tax=Litoribacterium kuwaitense TaxID=1398745 RepID=UPI0013EDD129|nr:VanZ family protein [Litoribacterium kuwaitense]NGP45364.1 hypothetical protein [Litoribacterium kuwaitense]
MKKVVWIVVTWVVLLLITYRMSFFTGQGTATVIEKIPTAENIAIINVLLRKLTHFFSYGALAVVLWWALKTKKNGFAIAWTIATLCGLFDEVCQFFHPNRTGAWYDVVINSAGAYVFLLVITKIKRRS